MTLGDKTTRTPNNQNNLLRRLNMTYILALMNIIVQLPINGTYLTKSELK